MAYAKKGTRTIVVGGETLWWRLRLGAKDGLLVALRPGGGQLRLTLAGWSDPWLAFPSPSSGPASVTPGHIRSAVEWAIAAGWKPAERVVFTATFHPGSLEAVQSPY